MRNPVEKLSVLVNVRPILDEDCTVRIISKYQRKTA